MNSITIGVLSGLVASILTVIVTKILEMLQEDKKHKNSLQKFYMEKKLAAAENLVSTYTLMAANCLHSYLLMDRFSKNDPLEEEKEHDTESAVDKNLNEMLTMHNEMANTEARLANPLYLYFDVPHNQEDVIPHLEIHNLIAGIGELSDNIFDADDLYQEATSDEEKKVAMEKLQEAKQAYASHINLIAKRYLLLHDHMNAIIKNIRIDIKKFEPIK